jgi:hypothetical protein
MTTPLLAVAAAVLACGGVTPTQAASVGAGDSRQHVQQVFGTTGTRVTTWVGARGWSHMWKDYPGTGGATVQVVYSHGPHQSTYRVARNGGVAWCTSAHVPCTDGPVS